MKQLKTEVIQLPQMGRATNWTELFNVLYPKLSSINLDEFVELKVTAGNIQITRVVSE